jgi:hypothetical protein
MAAIQNPSLELTFLAGDLEIGRPSTQTVLQDSIIRRSVTFTYQLLNGLRSSSNQVSLQLDKDCPSIEDIIRTDGDIKAVFKDGDALLFTGYLSTNYSWRVTHSGKQALEITLEDVGTRLLGKAFIPSGQHLFNCSASAAIEAICASAGIFVSEGCTAINDVVTKTVDSTQSCKEIIDQMLYELNHVYYFDQAGELCLFKIDCTTTSGLPVLDKEDLYVVGGKAITLGKKIRQYKSARISFTRLGEASDYLIYRNTTGRGDGHPYCYMLLDAGYYFDGTETFSPSEWEGLQADTFREPALIGACNAISEIDLVGSNEIIAISNISTEFTAQSGSVSCTITAAGGPYMSIEAHNSGSLPYYITRMDAYAHILYVKDTNIVRTSDAPSEGESSDNLLQEELSFIHSTELAQRHANLLGQYHRYCNSQYSFYSKRNMLPGTLIRLIDNAFSGLVVNVLITAKTYTDESDLIGYHAVGISAFDLNAEAYVQRIGKGKNDAIGPPGLPGVDGTSFTVTIESSNGSVFRLKNISTTLFCRVYLNTEEITETLDASRFCWKRSSGKAIEDESWNTSSKAIGHKSIEITPTDCTGRTVFFCEIDLEGYHI